MDQAIGMLMAVYGFSAECASDVLSDQAHNWNRTLRDQAAHIIAVRTPPN